ncbi:hypothetical protein JQ634_13630 [Bradyrhizobium sp. AUGA SZCCT0240]|jgi:hypothetical protein|uniref:hypothetical protein n=1 Tax=unclassified Bradyrhizobium TaxID=2631580 RepID=UPI001BABF94A|nr:MULTISPECIES: hypothetical protein [unclassified Bradyrhizobium]MBR1196523.1 hypothetical protein [Bradyrhizobium sp. AUGA SZCCT0158]MBR1254741.1 hypothetical protein [Bradyrhizobium sp. AUGA SZCCT0240]
MLTNNMGLTWKASGIALFAMALALVGGLSLFNKANLDTKPTAAVEPAIATATNCAEFEAKARKLFDQGGDTATLSGTFASGDHVHLAIDFIGVSYSWESTGVLGIMPNVSGSRWYSWLKYTAHRKATYSPEHTLISSVSNGKISGLARLEVKLDVATAGDGAITIKKTSGLSISPTVVIASCKASNEAPPIARGLSS